MRCSCGGQSDRRESRMDSLAHCRLALEEEALRSVACNCCPLSARGPGNHSGHSVSWEMKRWEVQLGPAGLHRRGGCAEYCWPGPGRSDDKSLAGLTRLSPGPGARGVRQLWGYGAIITRCCPAEIGQQLILGVRLLPAFCLWRLNYF